MRRVVPLECYMPKCLPYMNEKKHNTLLLRFTSGGFVGGHTWTFCCSK